MTETITSENNKLVPSLSEKEQTGKTRAIICKELSQKTTIEML
jgi:hypothetical protein